jgi:hypothetical protein
MNKTGNEGGSVTIPLPDQDGFASMAWWNNLTERERAYWAFLAKTGKGVRRLGTVQGPCRRGRGHGDLTRHTTVRRVLLRGPKGLAFPCDWTGRLPPRTASSPHARVPVGSSMRSFLETV